MSDVFGYYNKGSTHYEECKRCKLYEASKDLANEKIEQLEDEIERLQKELKDLRDPKPPYNQQYWGY